MLTSLPRPIEAYTWFFQPSASPLQFRWITNFGLQGVAAFWHSEGWVTFTSPCCGMPVSAQSPGPGGSKPEWTCDACQTVWPVMGHLWATEGMAPHIFLNSGCADLGLSRLSPWLVSGIEALGADPLTSEIVASRLHSALQALATAYLEVSSQHEELIRLALEDLMPADATKEDRAPYELAAERQVWHKVYDDMTDLCFQVNLRHR